MLRIWCFGDGYGEHEGWSFRRKFPFQTAPGVYNDANLRRLDFVLNYGGSIGLRFVCALVNNWWGRMA